MKAPTRKRMTQFDHVAKAASTVRTPVRTSIAIAKSDVAGMGMASDSHQVAVQRKTPSVRMPMSVTSGRAGEKTAAAKSRGPRQMPISRLPLSESSRVDSPGTTSATSLTLIAPSFYLVEQGVVNHFEASGSRLKKSVLMNGPVRYLGSSTNAVTIRY